MIRWTEGVMFDLDENCVYEGVTYTQDVILMVNMGQKVRIFDPRMLAKRNMVGKKVKIWIKIDAFRDDEIKLLSPDAKLGIVPKKPVESMGQSTAVTGKVVAVLPHYYDEADPKSSDPRMRIEFKNYETIISMPEGNLVFYSDKKYQLDEVIALPEARLDLLDVEFAEPNS